ncbi:MAG TPA: peptidylprolyl isomerase [Candidatus Limiplasma sp.]|nr:peptidylprolyl isomerase [Candidatus Limiplasma sp.]HRX08858.1 peptidylprolyl isomerase [Candidatus Limiplasma sp.]
MRKYAILVSILAIIVAMTSSCGLIVKDEAVDAQTVIIEVAGEKIVKSDVQQTVQNVLDYQEYIYSLYGLSFDRTDPDSISSAQDTAINSLIEEAVTTQKIVEYGLDQFTDEELAALNQETDETYAGYLDTVKTQYFADTQLTGDELTAAVEAKMLEIGYGTKEALLEQNKATEELTRLKDYVVKDVAVTEDEITAQYNEGMTQQINDYANDLTQYATDVNNGEIIYFRPHGYRYVKNLLIMISADARAQISSLNSQITSDQNTVTSLNESIAALPEDPATDSEDQTKTRADLTAQVETLNTEIADLTAQLNELTATAFAEIQSKVDLVEEKIQAGDDFDALIAEYGEDTGMTVEPRKSEGYLLCAGITTYVDEFVTEGMSLVNIGDISKPFRSSYGVHILQYASDLDGGKVPLSSVHDQIAEDLLATKQTSVYDETVSQWVKDANAKIHADRLDN